jgi:trehalose 6-phosphate synthase
VTGAAVRLLICSNSGPAPPAAAQPLRAAAAGGLVPHLLALLRKSGGEWFFAAGSDATAWPGRVDGIGLHPVALDSREQRLHYHQISIETLLWLFHYLHDTAVGPVFDRRLHAAWATYRAVNERFADRVAATASRGGGDDVVLVNDYHLMMVPAALVRRTLPGGTRLVYAHQVPWCEPDYFGILPPAVREAVLSSLLCCDTVVFHAPRWRAAFAACCTRYLHGVTVDRDGIGYAGRRTAVRAVPFPLDTATVLNLRDAEPTRRWRARIADLAEGRRAVVRVDRLDLWKNHLRGFAAFDELLRRHLPAAADLWFLVVLTPTRYRSPRHRAYETACHEAVARLNDAASALGRPEAVTLLYPDPAAEHRHRAVAALGTASAVLINPTYDGFNLVAKEATLLGDDATVLLSRTAGAYDYLAPAVRALDPFDVTATADALQAALVDGVRPDAVARARVRAGIVADSAQAWLAAVLTDG